ncbi:hypothetical protein BGZ58_003934 [Dissophora ornata]|nr:hypothetical protein BGZ58_003934 [Dissophora ornata]
MVAANTKSFAKAKVRGTDEEPVASKLPICINKLSNVWLITVITGVQTHEENVLFAADAYLDVDGFIDGRKVTPVFWADTMTELTAGQKTDYEKIANEGYRIKSNIPKDQGSPYLSGKTSVWKVHVLNLLVIQATVDQLFSNKYCEGIDCGVKLTRENTYIQSRVSKNGKNPQKIARKCKKCLYKLSLKNGFPSQVRDWANHKLRDRPGDFKSKEVAMMAYVTTIARGFCVGTLEFDPLVFVALQD